MPCRVHRLDLRGILRLDLLRVVGVVVIGVVDVVFDLDFVDLDVGGGFEEEWGEYPAATSVCVTHSLPRIDNHPVVRLMELVGHERDQNCCQKMMTSRVGLVRMSLVAT